VSAQLTETQNDRHQHTAKYLILLKDDTAQRALLFGGDHRYLTELIDDDGLVLENLIRFGTACLPPGDLVFDAVISQAAARQPINMRCFALG
jgi:hypothetical protein